MAVVFHVFDLRILIEYLTIESWWNCLTHSYRSDKLGNDLVVLILYLIRRQQLFKNGDRLLVDPVHTESSSNQHN